ncbi:VanW family protein [Paenibacillus rigui]|uniref:Vancomycin resistance protein n=1 Tax=Paenibacillus rigui TaxID=554312 RepID=A0A229UQ90_9BACL|nr:VanW family protein [Paenibacillus rigui]OXM85592.1 vancomycin resistance protein [Paenibacillus rigui]
MKKLVLRCFPFLYKWRVQQLILKRHIINFNPKIVYARERQTNLIGNICKRHKSVLRRVLQNSDPILQENKIKNLNLALGHLDGIVINPGETFSFWRLVGKTTRAKGYIDGLMLSNGEVRTGPGGGLCQLANMLFWLALHTPLEIKERHHHSFDLFPDDRRVIPFGTGTSIFYNYIDLQFYNPTSCKFQFHLFLSDDFLEGSIQCSDDLEFIYKIEERNHQFYEKEGRWYRTNEIWRLELSKEDHTVVHERLIMVNNSEVKYMKPGVSM